MLRHFFITETPGKAIANFYAGADALRKKKKGSLKNTFFLKQLPFFWTGRKRSKRSVWPGEGSKSEGDAAQKTERSKEDEKKNREERRKLRAIICNGKSNRRDHKFLCFLSNSPVRNHPHRGFLLSLLDPPNTCRLSNLPFRRAVKSSVAFPIGIVLRDFHSYVLAHLLSAWSNLPLRDRFQLFEQRVFQTIFFSFCWLSLSAATDAFEKYSEIASQRQKFVTIQQILFTSLFSTSLH